MKPFIQKCSEVLFHICPKRRAVATWKRPESFPVRQWDCSANSTAKRVPYSTAKIPVGTFNFIKKYTHFVSILNSSEIGFNYLWTRHKHLLLVQYLRGSNESVGCREDSLENLTTWRFGGLPHPQALLQCLFPLVNFCWWHIILENNLRFSTIPKCLDSHPYSVVSIPHFNKGWSHHRNSYKVLLCQKLIFDQENFCSV